MESVQTDALTLFRLDCIQIIKSLFIYLCDVRNGRRGTGTCKLMTWVAENLITY